MSTAIATSQGADDAEEEKKPADESDDDILKEARERYRICDTFDDDNREAALDDLNFLSGGLNQWDPISAQIRTAEKRPCLTINNLPTFLHQVTNDLRQNKLGGRVHPVEDTDEDTADVVQGLIRHIEYDSNATTATMTAVTSAASIGFGWFRLVTEYESEQSFDQKIMFRRIRNALSVHIDPLSQELDGSDMKYCFVDSLESRAEFKKQYPNAKANNADLIGQEVYSGWFTTDTVLVCEYYRIKTTEETLCELVDGTKGWKSELPEGSPSVLRERKSQRCVVEWFKLTGADILDRTVIKCKWIPVFPVYGDEIDIQGKVVRKGIIRDAKDPFRAYNFWITCATEEVALRPKSPFIMAEGQAEGHPEWDFANQRSYSKLEYKPVTVGDILAPPPQRQPMADVPAGMLAMAMHAADNKKACTGLFDSSLGARGSATSGIQEREQQQQGDVANYHFADNLKITYRHTLRCIVNMIPHYYDGARTVRMLGEDEDVSSVKINQEIEQKNPKTGAIEKVMHDLTVGDFDMTVSAGPAYSTKRQEAAEFLTDAMQAAKDPAAASVLTYLAIKNQDLPGAEEATKMLKKLLPPGVAEPEDEGEEPMVPTPHGPVPMSKVGPMIEQMGTALQNADKQMEQADLEKQHAEALKEQNRQDELQIKSREADTNRYEAETARMTADAALLTAQAESAAADGNVLSVAQAAAREAVSIILSTHPDQLHPDVLALAKRPPAEPEVPVPPVEQQQPQVPA